MGRGGGGGERSHRFHSRPRFSFHAAESLRLGTRKEKTYQKNRQLGRPYTREGTFYGHGLTAIRQHRYSSNSSCHPLKCVLATFSGENLANSSQHVYFYFPKKNELTQLVPRPSRLPSLFIAFFQFRQTLAGYKEFIAA